MLYTFFDSLVFLIFLKTSKEFGNKFVLWLFINEYMLNLECI